MQCARCDGGTLSSRRIVGKWAAGLPRVGGGGGIEATSSLKLTAGPMQLTGDIIQGLAVFRPKCVYLPMAAHGSCSLIVLRTHIRTQHLQNAFI